MLKMLSSRRPNALNIPAEHVCVSSLEFFNGKFMVIVISYFFQGCMFYSLYQLNFLKNKSHKVLKQENMGPETKANLGGHQNLSRCVSVTSAFSDNILPPSISMYVCFWFAFLIQHFMYTNIHQVGYAMQQYVCSVQLYFKYESAEKCCKKFWYQFTEEPVPSKQRIHYLVNKLKPTALLIRQKGRQEQTVLTEEKLDHTVLDLKLHQGNILND